jgi:putative Mg2+ transporter-C (MgtC) family protein
MASSWWQQIGETIASEFSDLPDAEQATRVMVRLVLAALLGGLLGIEREQKGKAAGVPTCWWPWAPRCSCWCRSSPACSAPT